MSYPVGGAACEGPKYGGMGAAAFALVLFVLLVIILKAGYGGY
ncbi:MULTISPECIES: sporulation protein YjcZ [Cohnella]|nr:MULTISPECIES: sporulation protein YjcZ [Cohnella]MBN2980074.1 sporulation protein YjcZ [Cohnella algarum]